MGADDPLGMRHARRDLGDRDRGGISGEHRLGVDDRIEFGEDLTLDVELFENRLDHESRAGQVGEIGRDRNSGTGRFGVVRIHRVLRDETSL